MAAYQLATAGVKVLMLEAGRMLDARVEYRTMEWPYQSMRRHRLPPGERPIAVAEYNFLDRPYGTNPAFEKHKKVLSYSGNTFTRNWLPNERENPTTGTPYALVRARVLDELFLTITPLITSDEGAPGILTGPRLPEDLQLELLSVLEHSGDLFLRYAAR
jgi:hypothetical protein